MEPFRVDAPDIVLNDLQTRLERTRWADDFENEGWQYGKQMRHHASADTSRPGKNRKPSSRPSAISSAC